MIVEQAEAPVWSRRHPFPATLLRKVLLSPPEAPRAKYHYELSLAGSGMCYQPGDSLAIYPQNDPALVGALLLRLGWTGEEQVVGSDGQQSDLRDVLLRQATITKPSRRLLAVAMGDLAGAVSERAGPDPREIIDLLEAAPDLFHKIAPQEFVALLARLQPRLYSLASSMRRHGEIAHLFISSVEYESLGRRRKGVCTSYLAERLATSSTVPVFIHAAPHFHLPDDPNAAVIMIGAGTGIAPFRAFLEDRAERGAAGKNWLFFGQSNSATGFYYREDWIDLLHQGTLTQLDTAFSHDQPERIYVQHRILEHAVELWRWLGEGAHVYLCGSARTLAPAVDAALKQVAQQCGPFSPQAASAFVQRLHEEKRYHRDVY